MEKRSTRRSNSDVRHRARAKQEVSETAEHGRPIPHILVVDDEKLICEQLQRSYSDCGYTVDIAVSGENALDRLKTGDIDLIVTDIRLPGMSGVELTMQVRDSFPDIPVIVITGHAAIDSAIHVLKRGASDYIIKPFSTAATKPMVSRMGPSTRS